MLKILFFVISNYDNSEKKTGNTFFVHAENLRSIYAENQGSAQKLRKKERANFKLSNPKFLVISKSYFQNESIATKHIFVGWKKVIFLLSFHYKV